MLCELVWNHSRIYYLAVSLGYYIWKKESKLELATVMVCRVMSRFHVQKNVIILCDSDSWHVKKPLVFFVYENKNLDLIGNVKLTLSFLSVASPIGEKGGLAKHDRLLLINNDYIIFDGKVSDYYIGVCRRMF